MSEKTTCVEKSDTPPRLRDDARRGQTLTEYAIILSMVMLLMFGVVGVFLSGVGLYYLNLVKIITLPFP